MSTHTHLIALFSFATVAVSQATEPATPATVAEQSELSAYTTPLAAMFGIIEQINTNLAAATDEDSAEAAGEAILELLPALDAQAAQFSSLPIPSPEVQAEMDTWFAEREHIMETMVQEVERLTEADPAFYGSQTLIQAIVLLGGVLGGAE
ncbi:MAG: hypothetical protein IKW19_06985 [Akkermansia sp.]|nr:hypothetical protein [Akkermansia sp.]